MFNLQKHHSLRYLYNRAVNKAWAATHPDAPWLPRQTVRFLQSWLKKEHLVLETGSGRSTLWLAKRVSRIFSIEHNKDWFNQISSSNLFAPAQNVQLNFANPNPGIEPFGSEYVRLVSGQEDETYDLLIVDGVLRDEVALKGLSKVRPGGLILIDNAERYVPVNAITPEKSTRTPSSVVWEDFLNKVKDRSRWEFTDGVTVSLVIKV
jgi:predicted O-methyltransferase YrrM